MFIFDSEDTKKGDPRWIAFDRLFHVVVVGLSHCGSRMVIANTCGCHGMTALQTNRLMTVF